MTLSRSLALVSLVALTLGCGPREARATSLDEAWQRAIAHADSRRMIWTGESAILYAWAAEIDGEWATPGQLLAAGSLARVEGFQPRFTAKAIASLPPLRRSSLAAEPTGSGELASSRRRAGLRWIRPSHRVHDPADVERSDQCLALVVDCAVTSSCIEFATAQPASGYYLSHQALYLNMLLGAGCRIPGELELESTLRDKAEAMAAEARVDAGFSDLFVERVALIYMSGHPELIDPASLETVLSGQRADGLFFDPELAGCDEGCNHQHIHGLGVLVLAYARAYGAATRVTP